VQVNCKQHPSVHQILWRSRHEFEIQYLKGVLVFHTLIVYAHLLATCAVIGTIVVTDLRLLAKVMGYKVVIPKPERFEAMVITIALVGLYVTGSLLVWMGLTNNPLYLHNEKLQAKLILVVLLTLNAFFLHIKVFPILERSQPVSKWYRDEWTKVAASVSLSNSTWFFCAFLGIARPWNNKVPLEFVLSIALAGWAVLWLAVNIVLFLASRDAPKAKPDWIDSVKASLSDFAALGKP
jgi:hypothetical protein